MSYNIWYKVLRKLININKKNINNAILFNIVSPPLKKTIIFVAVQWTF